MLMHERLFVIAPNIGQYRWFRRQKGLTPKQCVYVADFNRMLGLRDAYVVVYNPTQVQHITVNQLLWLAHRQLTFCSPEEIPDLTEEDKPINMKEVL